MRIAPASTAFPLPVLRAWVLMGTISAVASAAPASDRHYVLPDGTKIRMTRSTDEVGVVFRTKADAVRAKARVEAAGEGPVEDIAVVPSSPLKVLRTKKSVQDVRRALRTEPTVLDVAAVYRFAGDAAPVLTTGTIAVRPRPELSDRSRASLWKEFGIAPGTVEPFEGLPGVYLIRPGEGADELLLAEQLATDGRTVWATPSLRQPRLLHQVIGSDTYLDEQWHLNNTGQFSGTKPDADIDAPEAWALSTGDGILVGALDDAFDVDHEDLIGNYANFGQNVTFPPTVPDAQDPRPQFVDDNHGTAVIGLAVAAANSIGVRGVAHRATFTASAGLSAATDDELARGFVFALERNVDVHNNSWGQASGADPPIIVDAIDRAFREGRDPDGEGTAAPRGMVIVFAAGNTGAEVVRGRELATLPQVIGVGSSSTRDILSTSSSFGPDIEFLAPGSDPNDGQIASTDVTDGDEGDAQGYNIGGFNQDIGLDIDPNGLYTAAFGGTSASCPIVTGVAALLLSVNPDLTATDVRVILEHTCDPISPDLAQYDPVTSRSRQYGFGRVNAHRGVVAAIETKTTGGKSWPDVPASLRADGSTLRWLPGAASDDMLVVSSDATLEFVPQDDACYHADQLGCAGQTLTPLPSGAQVLDVGCTTNCATTTEQSVAFTRPAFGRRTLAVYGRNSLGHYSWGAKTFADSIRPPAVTISASALSGTSPLSVQFNGNAVSDLPVDESRTLWDFELENTTDVNASTASANYTYIVSGVGTRIFTARLTMYDVNGNAGSSTVEIQVTGEELDPAADDAAAGDVRIIVGIPGTPGADDPEGVSPFAVELRLLSGTVGSVVAAEWDLGDGSPTMSGLVVPHTYVNQGTAPLVIPVTATVSMLTEDGTTVVNTATRIVTVQPGTDIVDPTEPDLPGTDPPGEGGPASPCGAVGLIPLFVGFASLLALRRRPG